jgi:hypothetical protein
MSSGLDDVARVLAEMRELGRRVREKFLEFRKAHSRFEEALLMYTEQVLKRCPEDEGEDLGTAVACFEELAKVEADLINILDAMLEALNEDYNALRELIDIYHRKIKPMLGK